MVDDDNINHDILKTLSELENCLCYQYEFQKLHFI